MKHLIWCAHKSLPILKGLCYIFIHWRKPSLTILRKKKDFCSGKPNQLTQRCRSPVVNFINILRAAFAPIVFHQKNSQSKTVIRAKLHKALLHKKVACKMLMKLTPVFPPHSIVIMSVLVSVRVQEGGNVVIDCYEIRVFRFSKFNRIREDSNQSVNDVQGCSSCNPFPCVNTFWTKRELSGQIICFD